MGADPVHDLDPLRHQLRRRGIDASFRPVNYLFQRGHPLMLEVTRAPDDSPGAAHAASRRHRSGGGSGSR